MKFYHIFILFGIAKLANAGCQGAYQQCGGINYHGSTCCENGYTCKYLNDYYYQCIPNNNNNNNNNNAKTTTTIKKTTTTTVTQYQTNISNTQFPRAQKTVVFNEPKLIKAGEIFDGFTQNGVWTSYGRGLRNLGDCKNVEGGSKDAVFRLETGATLQNVILGSDSIEHVHCIGDGCIIKNVWWDDVCEDALSLKGSSNQGAEFFIIGGGARNGSDKIIQHNSAGTVHIDGFTVNNSGKLYRACGNCKSGYQGVRHAIIKNVNANNVNVLAGINGNYGDTVIFQNINANNGRVCDIYEGNNTGREPTKIESKCQNQKECLCQH